MMRLPRHSFFNENNDNSNNKNAFVKHKLHNSFSNFFSVHLDDQARVVPKVDNAIHRINHYPADSVVCFVNSYPLESDLSCG